MLFCNFLQLFQWTSKAFTFSSYSHKSIITFNSSFVIDYRLQTKFAKVMFSQVSVCPGGGGIFQHALGRGCIPACIGQWGCESQHALDRGECLPRRVSAQGGVCLGDVCSEGCLPSGIWADPMRPEADPPDQRQTPPQWILRDTVNKRAVRIPLECILGYHYFYRMVYLFNFCCAILS